MLMIYCLRSRGSVQSLSSTQLESLVGIADSLPVSSNPIDYCKEKAVRGDSTAVQSLHLLQPMLQLTANLSEFGECC